MQTRTRQKWSLAIGGGVLILLLLMGVVLASGGVELPRSVLSSSGGSVSSSGLVLNSAMGQPVAGTVENGTIRHCSGFWCAAAAPVTPSSEALYLPLIIK
jgi:hypothetical protein